MTAHMKLVVLTANCMSMSSQSGRQSQFDPEVFVISSKNFWASVVLEIGVMQFPDLVKWVLNHVIQI